MSEYRVIITETLKRAVTVEAESREEAEEAVRRQYQNSEHILVAEDFDGVSFSAQYPEQQVELPYGKMKELFRKAERAGTHVCGYITFMQDCFTVQYSERSRTYAVSSGNKAFQPNMGGYSVYGSCLDGTDPCVRLEQYMAVERGGEKGWSVERCYILQQPLPQPERQMTDKPRPKTYRVQGSRQAARKITGFRALYFYYCYKLGIFPKGRPQNRARLHFLLREDLLKLNNISQEVRLLARHQIDTAEQLALYKKEQEVNIRELSAKRRVLQNALRTKAVRDSPKQADAHRAQIRELSERLKALRREVHLCDDIAERSGVMAEKLKAVREDAQKRRQKEEQQHEHIRRRS